MTLFTFTRVKSRFVFWFLVVALCPLSAFSVALYYQCMRALKKEAFNKLTAIRDLKVDRLNRWLEEREGDLRTIASDLEIRGLEQVLTKDASQPDDLKLLENARELFRHYLHNYNAFAEIFILHPQSGQILLSTELSREGRDKSKEPYFTEPFRSGELYIKDIYYSQDAKQPAMTFSLPIFGLGERHQIIGILAAMLDLQNTLYPLLLNRAGMGATGETLIVNKDAVALNELRWHENAPLNLKIQAEPAVLASRQETGIAETRDYRREPVLAAYTSIPKTQWGFVAKQDLKEVYEPINGLLRQMLLLFAVAVGVAYGIAYLAVKSISTPIIAMSAVSEKIAGGDLTVRFQLRRKDEFGTLAHTLNTMADALASRIAVQQGHAEFARLMVATDDLAEFRKILTMHLVAKTGSQIGAYYLLNPAEHVFKPFFSIGASPELLRPFAADHYEGEPGHALLHKTITHLTAIPADTPFAFKTTAGTAIPRAMLTIPIVIDEKVASFISLASLTGYSKEHIEVLVQNQVGFNTKFASLHAIERIKTLVQEMNAQNQELKIQAEELNRQSDLLRRQNLELEIKNQQIAEADRLKSEFLSNMSHELRTPLNSVIALSRVLMMQAKPKLAEEEFGYLEIIARNGKHLLYLINDILDLSKIEAGKVELSSQECSLREIIASVQESLAPLANEKGIALHVNLPADLPNIRSDASKVRQIIQNVVGNAVKFTEQGYVEIRAKQTTHTLWLAVQDTGIGIPTDALPHIFEEFRQVDGSTSRRYEGTGLGLAIALKYARLLGGNILVESTFGAGSTFTIILPLDCQAQPVEPQTAEALRPAPLQTETGKTVLVVDDELPVASVIAEYLTAQGYHTLTAASGKNALELARRHHPFAITLDLIMPDMDGWEILQTLKASPETADIPIIIVSVSHDQETALALGAVGYVTKPVRPADLLAEIYKLTNALRTSPATVMVVDDNTIDRQIEVQLIEAEGLQVIAAQSGYQCLDLLQTTVPDVLVLDLMMPGIDGFEVIERIRSDARTRTLPIIIVTAKDLTPADKLSLQRGAATMLAKSNLTPYELLKHINELLSKLPKERIPVQALPVASKNRLLLVEDSEAAIVQIKQVLAQNGYLVEVARGGQAAIDYIQTRIPDGIILDLMMPEIDGFEVLERLRSQPATTHLPVLILTAKDLTPADLKRLSANHIQQLIQKGDVDPAQLLFKVQLMLGSVPKSPKESPAPGPSHQGGGNPLTPTLPALPIPPLPIPPLPIPPLPIPPLIGEGVRVGLRDGERWEGERWEGAVKSEPVILVIEDNPDNLITLKAICRPRYCVLEAVNGEEGLQLALARRPDVILLDMALPVMDGYQVIARLKQQESTRTIPVIALTAHAMKGDREKILGAGCDDYLSKPVEPEELLACLEKWLHLA